MKKLITSLLVISLFGLLGANAKNSLPFPEDPSASFKHSRIAPSSSPSKPDPPSDMSYMYDSGITLPSFLITDDWTLMTERSKAHGLVGAGMGSLLSEDAASGAIAGALGAIVAESVACNLKDDLGTDWAANAGKFSSAVASFLAGQDVDVAFAAGNNSINNNFLQVIPVVIVAAGEAAAFGKVAWEVYAMTHEEQIDAAKRDVCAHVAEKMGCDPAHVEVSYEVVSVVLSTGNAVRKLYRFTVQKVGNFIHTNLKGDTRTGVQQKQQAPRVEPKERKTPVAENKNQGQRRIPPELPKLTKAYFNDMQTRSGVNIPANQRLTLKRELQTKRFEKLEGAALNTHRDAYRQKGIKDRLMAEWERHTGQQWPRTNKLVNDGNGNMIPTPIREEIHHIIPQQLGGPHEWWNVHPLSRAQHQGGVHGTGSPLNQIIKETK